MRHRRLLIVLGLLLLSGCGGAGQNRLPGEQGDSGSAASQVTSPQPTASPAVPEPSRSRRLPSREADPSTDPTAQPNATRSPESAAGGGGVSAAEKGFTAALTALPESQFQVTYDLANAPTDTLVVRWKPPQVAAEFQYLGMTYRVSGNPQTGAVEVCVKVAKRWVCDDQVPTQAVDSETLAAVLAAVNPDQLAAAAAQLASLPGAQFSERELAGTDAFCVAQASTTICLAGTGAPLLAEAVEEIELPGFSDIGLQATDYSADSGL